MRDKTRLHSNHVQAARNKAAEACKSVVEKWEQGKQASIPHFTSLHLVYDHRTATFHDDYDAVVRLRLTGSKREAFATAKNIGLRYLRRNQTGSGGGAPLGVRLNSGMLNTNGEV